MTGGFAFTQTPGDPSLVAASMWSWAVGVAAGFRVALKGWLRARSRRRAAAHGAARYRALHAGSPFLPQRPRPVRPLLLDQAGHRRW